ncbi:MAG: sporulation protein YtfJ [Ruminococcaceae bacterium]|nr:sporulation protein YtfJ [Oscillospiraceae bacterium]
MAEHPINNIMDTAMVNIKEMINVDTIIGNPVDTPDGSVIIPVSKVSFGLAAGGAEYGGDVDFSQQRSDDKVIAPVKYPFAGGSGAGVSISPTAFIVSNSQGVQLMQISECSAVENLVNMVPDVMNKVNELIIKKCDSDKG